MKSLTIPVHRWERVADGPLMAVAVAFLVAYAVPILEPGLSAGAQRVCQVVTWTAWGLFALDYLARLVLAEHRRRFFLRHLLDLAVIVLPLLRPLRLLRLVTMLGVVNRRATVGLRGQVAIYVLGGTALIGFCGALAVLDAERANAEANIVTFGDAAWWAMSTMTTVGYGDRYPTTGVGRIAAAGLMVAGIALLGVVTASVASWLIEHVTATEEDAADLKADIIELNRKLDAVLAERTGGSPGPSGGNPTPLQ